MTAEHVSRLQMMTEPDSKWDLSPNDVAAIKWALERITSIESIEAETVEKIAMWLEEYSGAESSFGLAHEVREGAWRIVDSPGARFIKERSERTGQK